ncbi:hypothetical protein SAMD00019534_114720 [Acytostelium subglobosum LB1]|uniref:hypothetical protein n=1 Tax=Acytostelium subglobosum LB1 TaxID=1410327 RepID=UPI000644AAB4|nr:hypothetical protein SAMD00019534_114720 [Acytostelium subglobosum LB1]GAM28296.1 hypothetical protein SAMD00019534_114720 [Acytostelium subglobosum LB1]|eukprot:XP_012748613.1 hypothetical protein SAMD00019534_114720 [Acytostelium subglobosum LB1]
MNNPQAVDQPAQVVAPAGALPADALPVDAGEPPVEVVVEVPHAPAGALPADAPLAGAPQVEVVAAPLVPRQITVNYANINFYVAVNGNIRYEDLRERILQSPLSVSLHNLRNLQGCVIEYRPAAVNAAVVNSNDQIPVGTNHVYITEPPVRIFKTDADATPTKTFRQGVSWQTIEKNMHLTSGGLRVRHVGDAELQPDIAESPYPAGDYTLVEAKMDTRAKRLATRVPPIVTALVAITALIVSIIALKMKNKTQGK